MRILSTFEIYVWLPLFGCVCFFISFFYISILSTYHYILMLLYLLCLLTCKVEVFWEGHRIWKNLRLGIYSKWKIFFFKFCGLISIQISYTFYAISLLPDFQFPEINPFLFLIENPRDYQGQPASLIPWWITCLIGGKRRRNFP